MKLYQYILFLKHYYKGLWCVENVIPYYKYLIAPTAVVGRHAFWANFPISHIDFKDVDLTTQKIGDMEKLYNLPLSGFKFSERKDRILRNCTAPEIGLHILQNALKTYENKT